jgi:transposase-like protein
MSRATPELREMWEDRVAEFQASSQSIPVWCAEHKVNVHTLRYWVRKLKREQPAPEIAPVKWLSVEVAGERHHVNIPDLVVNVGDARIEVHPGCDLLLLREVVQALASLC